MAIATVLSTANDVITNVITTTGDIVEAVPFILLPAAFIFGRRLIGMAKSLVFAGGRRRR